MNRTPAIQLAVAALCVCAAAASARAHHSHGTFYDSCKSLTLEGRLERVEWKDPHILFDFTLDDGTTYHGEWMGLRGLTTQGGLEPAQRALTFGTRIVVSGNLLRTTPEIRASFPEYKPDSRGPNLLDVMQLRRADKGWSWSQEGAGPACNKK
jgi:hypothetical protein